MSYDFFKLLFLVVGLLFLVSAAIPDETFFPFFNANIYMYVCTLILQNIYVNNYINWLFFEIPSSPSLYCLILETKTSLLTKISLFIPIFFLTTVTYNYTIKKR